MSSEPEGELVWLRGRSCESGACVEVAARGEAVLLRSSENPYGERLVVGRNEWREFLAGAKEGHFDGA